MTAGRVLAILSVAQLCAMAPWFSASAVAPTLAQLWHLDAVGTAGLTVSVQLGFVLGALVSAMLTLADVWSARRLVAGSAVLAGLATAGVAFSTSSTVGIGFRFLTGAALAGVYPPGMKIAAGWFREARGWAIGILVGALTLGSATPHLVRSLVPADQWRMVLLVAALSAWAGAALVLFVPSDGPFAAPSARFSWSAAPTLLRDRAVLLANLGYLGHMWELYAMWAWIGVFLDASFALTLPAGVAPLAAKLAAFATIAAGAIGSVAAGVLADRLGRTTLTIVAMAVSGSCAATVGLLFGGDPAWLVALCIVWGVSIVADSAQFSASIAELSDRAWVGTMLTLQTALGFTLTLLTIHLMPYLIDALGWRHAFVPLAIGPAFGVWAMARLRAHPRAVALAGGRR